MQTHELVALLQAHAPTRRVLRKEYGIDFSQAELLKSSFNLVYSVGSLILRLSPARKKGLAEIRSELKWLRFLAAKGLPVNEVVATKSGGDYLTLTAETSSFFCVVFNKIIGQPLSNAEWGAEHFRSLGKLTASLHRASIDFHPLVDEDFPHWYDQSKVAAFRALPSDERRLPEIWKSLHQKFVSLPQTPGTYGIIHYDIHYGNYLLQPDRPGHPIGLFDFEMTCRAWFLQDIAVVLYYASNRNTSFEGLQREEFERTFLNEFHAAYCKIMPDIVFDEVLIQDHLLYRDLFVYSYVLDAWRGRELTAGDTRFIRLLEANIAERSSADR